MKEQTDLAALAFIHASHQATGAYPSQRQVAAHLGLTHGNARAVLNRLIAQGLLCKIDLGRNNTQLTEAGAAAVGAVLEATAPADLTPRQRQVLEVIHRLVAAGRAPSQAEIAVELDVAQATLWDHVEALRQRGYVETGPDTSAEGARGLMKRNLRVTPKAEAFLGKPQSAPVQHLTERQLQVLRTLHELVVSRRASPTYVELAAAIGVDPSNATKYLKLLEARRYIVRSDAEKSFTDPAVSISFTAQAVSVLAKKQSSADS